MSSKPILDKNSIIRKLIKKVSDLHPCGHDLSSSDNYFKLTEKAKSIKKEIYHSYTMNSNFQLPDAQLMSCIRNLEQMLKETKDLYICALLTELWTIQNGAKGAKDGLTLAYLMLKDYWTQLYPTDVQTRLNIMFSCGKNLGVILRSTASLMSGYRMHVLFLGVDAFMDTIVAQHEINAVLTKLKFIGLDLEKAMEIIVDIENIFYEKVAENLNLSETKATIDSGLRLVFECLKGTEAEQVQQVENSFKNTQETFNEPATETSPTQNTALKTLLAKEKIYNAITQLTNDLLKLNKSDLIGLVVQDVIKTLRDKEAANILKLVEDQEYFAYLKRFIRRAQNH